MIQNTPSHWRSLLCLSTIVCAFVVSSFSTIIFCNLPTSAIESGPSANSKRLLYAGWLAACMEKGESTYTHEQMDKWKITIKSLTEGEQAIGQAIATKDGRLLCDEGNVESQSTKLGYKTFKETLIQAGCKESKQTSTGGIPDIKCDLTKLNAQTILINLLNGNPSIMTDADRYYISYVTFMNGCDMHPATGDETTADKSYLYPITTHTVDPTTKQVTSTTVNYYSGKQKPGESITTMAPTSVGKLWPDRDGKFTCESLSNMASDGPGGYAGAYSRWLATHPESAISEQEALKNDSSDSKPVDSTTTCNVEGIGWIVCPVMNFLGKLSNAAYKGISEFLSFSPKFILYSPGEGTYEAWKVFRDIANIIFVIAFLVIIMSQLTGFGISNYGIKKLLPQLIITAVLINVSFFLCQIAVDISEILGASLYKFFTVAIPSRMSFKGAASSAASEVMDIATPIAIIVGAGISLALVISVPVLISVILALLMTLLILIARKAAIIILIAIAPLAIIAYLLPNTKQWFTKWSKMLVNLLMVYPIIALLYGGCRLAGIIINNTSSDDPQVQITAIGVSTIPLIATPFILKGAMSATGKLGGVLSGMSSKANSRMTGHAKSTAKEHYDNSRAAQYMKYRADKKNLKRTQIQTGQYSGKGGKYNPNNWRSKANKRFNEGDFSGAFGDRSAAAGVSLMAETANKELNEAEMLIRSKYGPEELIDGAAKELDQAIQSGDTIRARSAQKILLNTGVPGLKKLTKTIDSIETSGGTMHEPTVEKLRTDMNAAGMAGKDAVLSSWGYKEYDAKKDEHGNVIPGTGKRAKISELRQDAETFSGLNSTELAGQSKDVLEYAVKSGAITPNMAREVLESESARGLLTADKRQVLEPIASPKMVI